MNLSIPKNDLKEYLNKQLSLFFPDNVCFKGEDVDKAFDIALDKMEYCCSHANFRHFCINGQVNFKHNYSDQYSMFLYFVAKSLWETSQNKPICDKLVLLNRALHSILVPYTVNLPDIFLFVHPIGTILGNAEYSDYLVILQQVTVNTGERTKIGKGVFLSAGSKIIGDSVIGDRSSVGVNTVVHNREVPDDSIIYTDSDGKIILKPRTKQCKAQDYFMDFGGSYAKND